jgi:hypothetical protein
MATGPIITGSIIILTGLGLISFIHTLSFPLDWL